MAEIVRSGIMAVPKGQTEAGRSLGLTNGMTMRTIVFPQAIKNILPALGNEFIVLFKETSIVGYVAVMDLTRAAELVRSRTLDAFCLLYTSKIIEEALSERIESGLDLTYFSDNLIKGNLSGNEGKMLCFTIPYDKGWTAMIDGSPARVQKVNVGFIGIEIPSGAKEIQLQFVPQYLLSLIHI